MEKCAFMKEKSICQGVTMCKLRHCNPCLSHKLQLLYSR